MPTHSYRIGDREVTYTTRVRYAITHVNKDGLRQLTLPNQGRYHYDSREDAERDLEVWKQLQGLPRVLTPEQCATLAVREVECYDHGDAVRIYFED